MDYRLGLGTDDPLTLDAASDAEAVTRAVAILRDAHLDDLRNRPEAVVTLLGPNGLLTGSSERLDAFVERRLPSNPAADPDRLQPGEGGAPDCNAA